jgi:chromosome segregation ATPase
MMSECETLSKMLDEILREIKVLDHRLSNMENQFGLIKRDIESLDSSMGEIEENISSINDTVSTQVYRQALSYNMQLCNILLLMSRK